MITITVPEYAGLVYVDEIVKAIAVAQSIHLSVVSPGVYQYTHSTDYYAKTMRELFQGMGIPFRVEMEDGDAGKKLIDEDRSSILPSDGANMVNYSLGHLLSTLSPVDLMDDKSTNVIPLGHLMAQADLHTPLPEIAPFTALSFFQDHFERHGADAINDDYWPHIAKGIQRLDVTQHIDEVIFFKQFHQLHTVEERTSYVPF